MPELVYVLNGPNLNLLGLREPEIYGDETLDDIAAKLDDRAQKLGIEIDMRQSNHEGHLIDWLHEASARAARAVILNPGGYTHSSIALLDAVKSITVPVIEVHLSNPHARESFRHRSYIAKAAHGTIAGFGTLGYLLALDAAATFYIGAGQHAQGTLMSEDKPGAMAVDPELVRQLAELLDATHLTEIEVQDGDRRIRVARNLPAAAPAMLPAPGMTAAAAGNYAAAMPTPTTAPEPADAADHPGTIRSPMVGTAYLAAEPGAKPFVAPGTQVAAGDTLLIVEAMKVLNPIVSPRAGTVRLIFVDNGQPVEFDQPLIVVE